MSSRTTLRWPPDSAHSFTYIVTETKDPEGAVVAILEIHGEGTPPHEALSPALCAYVKSMWVPPADRVLAYSEPDGYYYELSERTGSLNCHEVPDVESWDR